MDKHVDVRLDLFFTAAIFVAIVMNIIILGIIYLTPSNKSAIF